METKENVRELCKKKRDTYTFLDCKRKSAAILKRILESDWFEQCENVLLYSAIRNEPDVTGVIPVATELGKHVYLPRVCGQFMDFYEIMSLDDCREGAFHILEPLGNKKYLGEDDSLVLVPGVAFHTSGKRIGFGKGYYDGYLSKHRELKRVGVCYDEFTGYCWKEENHDEGMNLIVTDKKEVLCDEFRIDV